MCQSESTQSAPEAPNVLTGLTDSLPTYLDSRSDDVFGRLYRPCLAHSVRYVRGAGYFRSSVYRLMSADLLNFCIGGGKVTLVTSTQLTRQDYEAAVNARTSEPLFSDLTDMLEEEVLQDPVRMLVALIANGCLDIRIAVLRGGIYHQKKGYFEDASGNKVAFDGSGNETAAALGPFDSGNSESFNVSWSWADHWEPHACKWVEALDRAVDGDPSLGFPVMPIDGVPQEFLELHEIDTHLPSHLEAAERRQSALAMRWDEVWGSEFNGSASETEPEGRPANRRKPLPHQERAIEAWKHQDCRGILEHATGSGKTFTAITAMKEHAEEGAVSLVFVPGKLLHGQWLDELQMEIPEAQILAAGAGHNDWKKPDLVEAFTSPQNTQARIVVSTMRTASFDAFRRRIRQGAHLMVVADEVHQMGSPENQKILELNAGKRLGLSATPKRYGDPDGTQALLDWFGGIVEPPYTLEDAIRDKRLVPYDYFPHTVHLSAEEADDWKVQTEKILQMMARGPRNEDGGPIITDKVRLALIQRSRIAKKAVAKVPLAVNIVQENFEAGSHWLVFCEDQDQLGDVINGLETAGISAFEYHSAMTGSQEDTLALFKAVGGVLVSIRCLDQGVDIPQLSHAVILASSQNPRQFIQRRGRVLRVDRDNPQKFHATVYDAIVVPVDADTEPEQISLLQAELSRAIEFARTARNLGADATLRNVAIDIGVDPDQFSQTGLELDDKEYD